MRVLYCHQHFSTPKGGVGIRSNEMVRRLVARGNQVTMACGSYSGGETGSRADQGASSVTLKPSTWHPAFGSTIPCQCIVAEFFSGKLVTHISWSGSV